LAQAVHQNKELLRVGTEGLEHKIGLLADGDKAFHEQPKKTISVLNHQNKCAPPDFSISCKDNL